MRSRSIGTVLAAVVAAVLFVVTALPAWAATGAMTLTFVRHGQSLANEAGVVDTLVPGPVLTTLGELQAEAVADALAGGGYDGVYASNMVRTQLTAAPLAARLGQSVVVLPGVREIGAGIFEGSSVSGLGGIGYALAPVAWVLGLRVVPILGSSDADGNVFDDRVDDAVQTIYDSGDRNPVVFSHGATTMFWVMMNVANPDPLLILTHPLGNTAIVVVDGSPDQGWTLTSWDGIQVDPNPSLVTRVFVAVRDLVTLPQTIAYRIGQSISEFVHAATSAPATPAPAGVVPVADRHAAADPAPVNAVVADATPDAKRVASLRSHDAATAAVAASPVPQPEVGDAEKSPVVAPNGATDLSAGNKVTPGLAGNTASASAETGQSEPVTLQAVVAGDATPEPSDDADASSGTSADSADSAEDGAHQEAA